MTGGIIGAPKAVVAELAAASRGQCSTALDFSSHLQNFADITRVSLFKEIRVCA
jgi:hypothetical protein